VTIPKQPRTSAGGTTAAQTAADPSAATKTAAKKAAAAKTAVKKTTAKKATAKKAAPKKGAAKRPGGPTDAIERELLAAGARVVAGVDEVGRGAWAGPVVVGAAVSAAAAPPAGLTDSKLLTPRRREELAPRVAAWVTAHAFGAASPEEIDELGMTAALRLAAVRALEALPVRPDAVVLDGKHDFLGEPWQVRTVVKGDQVCVGVAAASVLAKVYRDRMMAELGLDHPKFAFEDNAGYPSPVHRQALEELGPTPYHRMSWAYLDDLPRWRHLKKVRSVLEDAGQTALDF
jgi:ribonuclease HII